MHVNPKTWVYFKSQIPDVASEIPRHYMEA